MRNLFTLKIIAFTLILFAHATYAQAENPEVDSRFFGTWENKWGSTLIFEPDGQARGGIPVVSFTIPGSYEFVGDRIHLRFDVPREFEWLKSDVDSVSSYRFDKKKRLVLVDMKSKKKTKFTRVATPQVPINVALNE